MTQSDALEILKTGQNIFLTGPAGSGKTYVLNAYRDYLREHSIGTAVTASTGIAATHIGGMTIHSWSGLGVRSDLSDYDIEMLTTRQYLYNRYQTTKVLIIDEISMLHHFRFDLLDRLARAMKRNGEPFGGMQIILCGDFFQLPPVARPGEPAAHFAYHAKIWGEMNLKVCYLEEQHRQNDDAFSRILKAIRDNDIDEDIFEDLKSRFNAEVDSIVAPTKLATHNIDVDKINAAELEKISGAEKIYLMTTRGKGAIVEALIKSCLAPAELVLRIGARVMFVKNNFEKGYVNGTLGEITGFSGEGYPEVRVTNGKMIIAEPQAWMVDEEGKIKAEISQVPLRLAWAITVHKSQGMSLDAAEIDLSKSFAPGMGYVALSRVRTLAGLKLTGFNNRALEIHPEVLEIDRDFRRRSVETEIMLETFGKEAILKMQQDFLLKNGARKKSKEEIHKNLPTEEKTKLLLDEKLPLKKIAEARGFKIETIIEHIELLQKEGIPIDIEYIKKDLAPAKFKKIEAAFKHSYKNHGDLRLAPVKLALGTNFSYAEIRLARLFVRVN
ncbi:MAG: AAA family ATPase [Candidatus Paceibacterota bacterium]|jgi:ATP-dependent exoDNAse (exonuclease V) alpha subunit